MKSKTWTFVIVLILFLVGAICGYLVFKYFRLDNINTQKILLQKNEAIFYIDIRDYGFFPNNLSIQLGDTIVFKNLGGLNHSISFDNLNFSSGIIPPHENYSIVLNSSGEINYTCELHPSLHGEIFVFPPK